MPRAWGLGIAPFLAILASIALLPLMRRTHRWWESNRNRLLVAMACSLATLGWVFASDGYDAIGPLLRHAIIDEYLPFIVLLFSLYVISGGIRLSGDLRAHPTTNTGLLAFGACIASLVGTTGASMLLIRPLLATNAQRRHVVHTVVFFIFLVSNTGGTLLPIGDPPLFLGFLEGVPFFWTLGLWKPWAVCCGTLLVIYWAWDSFLHRREQPADLARDEAVHRPLRLEGARNLLLLAGVVACVACVNENKNLPGTDWTPFPFLREGFMLGLTWLSVAVTPERIRTANRFTYAAIGEVAALFIGIFITMQVPLQLMRASGESITDRMGDSWHFFWATGLLSSVLDNAPTYMVFFELSKTMPEGAMLELGDGDAIPLHLLTAISLGSVFMGAMSYIGNGPNFMVKAIAEQEGVRMPSFLGFMGRYSIPVLIPVFLLITLLFLL